MHEIGRPDGIGLQRIVPRRFSRDEYDLRVLWSLFQPVPGIGYLGGVAQIDVYDGKWPGWSCLPYAMDRKDERIENPSNCRRTDCALPGKSQTKERLSMVCPIEPIEYVSR
jgi:hypothetical protein